MFMLHIEHRAQNYEEWKKQFDSDPVGRERMGVRRYRILRMVDDPNRVMIDLEFDSQREARSALEKLRELWSRVGARLISDPQTKILEVAEARELKAAGAPMDK